MHNKEQGNITEIAVVAGAECELCHKHMLVAAGCTWGYIKHNGKLYERIRYGEEPDIEEMGIEATGRCHDCGALPGHFHHMSCDMEICPICGEQFIGCDCDAAYSDGKDE